MLYTIPIPTCSLPAGLEAESDRDRHGQTAGTVLKGAREQGTFLYPRWRTFQDVWLTPSLQSGGYQISVYRSVVWCGHCTILQYSKSSW